MASKTQCWLLIGCLLMTMAFSHGFFSSEESRSDEGYYGRGRGRYSPCGPNEVFNRRTFACDPLPVGNQCKL